MLYTAVFYHLVLKSQGIKGEYFLVFFSFLARNSLEFLVSHEKLKCEKNGNYKGDTRK